MRAKDVCGFFVGLNKSKCLCSNSDFSDIEPVMNLPAKSIPVFEAKTMISHPPMNGIHAAIIVYFFPKKGNINAEIEKIFHFIKLDHIFFKDILNWRLRLNSGTWAYNKLVRR